METYNTIYKLKELLDEGIISQEEFDEKKREFLFPKEFEEEKKRKQQEEEARKKEEEERLRIDSNNAVLYAAAMRNIDSKDAESYRNAISILRKIGDWRDAADLLEKCEKDLPELEKKEAEEKALELKAKTYRTATEKMEIKTSSSYREAIAAFESLGDWEDSKALLEKCKAEQPELEAKEQKEKAEKEKQKKKRIRRIGIFSAIVIAAIVGAVVLVNALKPNLTKYDELKEFKTHSMSYKIPESWSKNDILSKDNYSYYTLQNGGKTAAVLTVEYKGDTDLWGAAAYDASGDGHYSDENAIKAIPTAKGTYQTIEADNSAFEVTLYCDDSKVKNSSQFLTDISSTFNTKDYSNPRSPKDVTIGYDGSTEAGTTIDENSIKVSQDFDTGLGIGSKTPEWTLKEKVVLEAGKTSEIIVIVDGKEYKKEIECSTKLDDEESSGSHRSVSTSTRGGTTATSEGEWNFDGWDG